MVGVCWSCGVCVAVVAVVGWGVCLVCVVVRWCLFCDCYCLGVFGFILVFCCLLFGVRAVGLFVSFVLLMFVCRGCFAGVFWFCFLVVGC